LVTISVATRAADRDDGEVVTEQELDAAVESAFAVTGRGLARWPHPHPDRSPRDEEYSRVSDPAKWRLVAARADAWCTALVETGLAAVERDAAVVWETAPPTTVSRTDRIVPHAPGALPLLIGRSRIESVDDAGITLGVGDPALCVAILPHCGCDACDSGSQNELAAVDQELHSVVTGALRHLRSGDRRIIARPDGWSASGAFDHDDVESVLADPTGWEEVCGTSWLGAG
jgi:hypothetical protein